MKEVFPPAAPCKECGAAPLIKRCKRGNLRIECAGDECGLMFLEGYGQMTDRDTVRAWNKSMINYGLRRWQVTDVDVQIELRRRENPELWAYVKRAQSEWRAEGLN